MYECMLLIIIRNCLQYVCMGYSVYEADPRKSGITTSKGPPDSIELPYCEGLEVCTSLDTDLQIPPIKLH